MVDRPFDLVRRLAESGVIASVARIERSEIRDAAYKRDDCVAEKNPGFRLPAQSGLQAFLSETAATSLALGPAKPDPSTGHDGGGLLQQPQSGLSAGRDANSRGRDGEHFGRCSHGLSSSLN
jgi:hypothetical protein